MQALNCSAHLDRLIEAAPPGDQFGFVYVDDPTNIRWLTGFSGSVSRAVVDLDAGITHMIVDSRYFERCRDEATRAGASVEVHLVDRVNPYELVVASIVGQRAIALDPNKVTLSVWDQLSASCNTLRGSAPFSHARRIKSAPELERISAACAIADAALMHVVEHGICGMTERQVAQLIDDNMRVRGADDVSFPTIVASGPNGSRPHHEPGERVIVDGDAVVIDMGALVDGYHSDMTRTVQVGEWSDQLTAMYRTVRDAQTAGLSAVAAGRPGVSVDDAVRAVYGSAGVEHEYLHGTGHGVGLEIHEFPILNPACDATLLEGEVVTVEPGLYRGGVGGIRVEDLVVVTGSGCRPLTLTPKELSCPPSPRTT